MYSSSYNYRKALNLLEILHKTKWAECVSRAEMREIGREWDYAILIHSKHETQSYLTVASPFR